MRGMDVLAVWVVMDGRSGVVSDEARDNDPAKKPNC
jgi:hypothetical protein